MTINYFKLYCPSGWVIFLSLSITGCANEAYVTAPNFGSAVRKAVSAQTLNQDAGKQQTAKAGADGVIMKSTVDRYQSTYEMPPPPVNVFNIGVGGSAGGTGR
ncbi:hypothetical protein B9Z45_02900 [Limnohabitans sp. 2KL-17]|uniref:hypothetical protein n=1 Tax=Limnohabitans sp. 2KL-17 TaxID=1100704 RepID=UPI000D331A4F|nr:hypothetical protein [Limnohabitans sp. 2KL-17]PUE62772.1 hypothetical protein B9Z45_02900 [Limnohabitans sp. 2KL-17]